jgi:hypothetical protein
MVGQYADPSKGYAIATKGLVNDADLSKALRSSGTTYDAPLINEAVLGGIVMAGVYSYVLYKLI